MNSCTDRLASQTRSHVRDPTVAFLNMSVYAYGRATNGSVTGGDNGNAATPLIVKVTVGAPADMGSTTDVGVALAPDDMGTSDGNLARIHRRSSLPREPRHSPSRARSLAASAAGARLDVSSPRRESRS